MLGYKYFSAFWIRKRLGLKAILIDELERYFIERDSKRSGKPVLGHDHKTFLLIL